MIFKYKYHAILMIVVGLAISTLGFSSASTSEDQDQLAEYKSQLDSVDRDQARSAIRKLGRTGSSQAVKYLKGLWSHGDVLKSLRNPEIVDDPVVRIMLAQQLLSNGETANGEYSSYIKSKAQSQNWIIRANAADALASVTDAESVELLYEIALTPHRLVALRAVRSLEKLSRSETMSQEAMKALEELLSNPGLDDQEVREAAKEAHQKLMQSERSPIVKDQRKGAEGFVPLSESTLPDPYRDIPALVRKAESGNPQSQHILGERYLVGVDAKPNYIEALKWLTLAVQQDYAPAKLSLAEMYLSGRGVEVDKVKAIELLESAKAQGYEPATKRLEILSRRKKCFDEGLKIGSERIKAQTNHC